MHTNHKGHSFPQYVFVNDTLKLPHVHWIFRKFRDVAVFPGISARQNIVRRDRTKANVGPTYELPEMC